MNDEQPQHHQPAEHHTEHHTEPAHHAEHHGDVKMPEMPKVDFKGVNAGSLQGGLGDVLEILKMNKTATEKVANRDSEGLGVAIVYFSVGTIVASLGPAVFGIPIPFLGTIRTDIVHALIAGVVASVLGMIGIFVLNWVAESMFKGTGKFPQFFRVIGYASIIRAVGLLTFLAYPLLDSLAGIWLLVVTYKALTDIHKLNSTNAVLTLVVAAVLAFVVGAVLGMVGLGAAAGVSYSIR